MIDLDMVVEVYFRAFPFGILKGGHPRLWLRPHILGPRRSEFGCTGLEDVENYLNEWHGQEELPRLIEECAQAVSDEASG